MILPDANLLLYAEDSLSEHHDKARTWWDGVLSGSEPVNLCWPVLNAFIRIATNARLHQRPLKSGEAMARVQSWFEQPCVRVVNPSENHWALFQRQIRDSGAVGSLIPDAHLAALAIEHGCTLFSADQDFAKFPLLRWVNPLSGKSS